MTTIGITIEELLQTTSRTFALSIPLLPAPLDHQITLAYLVFRISDTLEDADHLDRDTRQTALRAFHNVLADLRESTVAEWTHDWSGRSISENEDYNRLLRETPRVLGYVRELNPQARSILVRHAMRSAEGMAVSLDHADASGNLHLKSVQDLKQYCYYVAGIVGEMITELFVASECNSTQGGDHDQELAATAATFGEALQLVNILKDARDDKQSGRTYMPQGVPRATIFELARQDLQQAGKYVAALHKMNAPCGFIAFCDAPLQLAEATLRVVEQDGPGSKIPRNEVFELLEKVLRNAGVQSPEDTNSGIGTSEQIS